MKSQPSCRPSAFNGTHSSSFTPVPIIPLFHSHGVYIVYRSLPPQVPLSVSPGSRVLHSYKCKPMRDPTPRFCFGLDLCSHPCLCDAALRQLARVLALIAVKTYYEHECFNNPVLRWANSDIFYRYELARKENPTCTPKTCPM